MIQRVSQVSSAVEGLSADAQREVESQISRLSSARNAGELLASAEGLVALLKGLVNPPALDVVALMRELEPAAPMGALVLYRDMIAAWHGPRHELDAEVWRLMRAQRLALHRHGHSASLSAEARAACLELDGAVYHAVSVRKGG